MPRSGPRQVYKYTKELKLAAGRLSHTPGTQVKAAAFGIHPFMLPKWRKDARDGTLRGRLPKATPPGPAREIARLQQLEREHALLLEQHDILVSHPVLRLPKADAFAFIHAERGTYGVARLCRRLGLTRGGYYAWQRRQASAHAVQDDVGRDPRALRAAPRPLRQPARL